MPLDEGEADGLTDGDNWTTTVAVNGSLKSLIGGKYPAYHMPLKADANGKVAGMMVSAGQWCDMD